ncbi:MAG: acyl-coenzyme A thioesterase PaaI-like protein [Bacteroidia bacterium]|jgi:acyl-coenzyme A thioesterase PaaI-like protein
MSQNRILATQEKLRKVPFGNRIFSGILARFAPYFTTIKPRVIELRPNYMKSSMRKRRAVHNHLKTVHAIAMCNLCEFTGGILMEASIPKHRRWIPVGMTVNYVKKASTDLTAICDLSAVEWDTCDKVICQVSVRDANDVEVMNAAITMLVSDKPKK